MKRALYSLIVVCLITSLLAGCGKSSETNTGTSSGKKITLRVAWWGSQDRHDRTVKALELYASKNSNVTIESEFTGWDGYWDKLASQAASSTLPDVWQNSVNYVLQYVDKGQLVDMTPYVNKKTIDLSNWSDAVIDNGRVNNKIYAISMGSTAHCLVYDPELFKKAGVAEPTFDWTWEDYISAANTIKQKLGIPGDSDFPGSGVQGFEHYLRQNGLEIFSKDNKSLGYTDDNLFVKYNQMAVDLMKSGGLMEIAKSLEIKALEQTPIVKGQAAMVGAINSNQIIALSAAAGKQFKAVPLPHAKGEKRWGTWIGPSMLINISSKNNTDESAKLVNFILNDIEANKILLAERGVPGGSKCRDGIKDLLTPASQTVLTYLDSVVDKCKPNSVLKPPAITEITDLYLKLEQDILFGRISPDAAAKEFRQKATAMLNK